MTRAQRIASLTSDVVYIAQGVAYMRPSVARRIHRELAEGLARLPEGVTIVAEHNVPSPYPKRRAKKIVRRIHRARLKHRGKPWV